MATITIPGASGATTITVTGAQTLAFAQTFAQMVHNASTFVDLSTGQTSTINGSGQILYNVDASSQNVSIPAASSGTSDVVVFDNGPLTIQGSGAGDLILVTGVDPRATYVDSGGNNAIGFVDGNNLYQGDTAFNAGNDTIVAGSGFDTIITGVGSSLVNSGTGDAFIVTNDGVGQAGDTVYLEGGQNIVAANGMLDSIIIGVGGQAIYAGNDTAAAVTVVITAGGGNTIHAGGATVSIFDAAGGNSIIGGTGDLYFVAGAGITDTISNSASGAGGGMTLYGAAGDVLTLTTLAQSNATYVAGAGAETLNGAGSAGQLVLAGDNGSDTTGATAQTVLIGGAANDFIQSGEGNETLTGGAGTNEFFITPPNDSVAAHILISDFGSGTNDVAAFGYTPQQVQAALQTIETVSGAFGTGVEIQFNDGTTVIFAGVTTLDGHLVNG